MKRIQWLTISAEKDTDDHIRFSITGVKAEQTYVVDHAYMDDHISMIRIGTLVEPSMKTALQDFKDAVHNEMALPILKFLKKAFDLDGPGWQNNEEEPEMKSTTLRVRITARDNYSVWLNLAVMEFFIAQITLVRHGIYRKQLMEPPR